MFSPIEKFAIWTAYKGECSHCGRLLPYQDSTIDHILPKILLKRKEDFERLKDEFGLNADFEINSYYNLVPACSSCNSRKNDRIFKKQRVIFHLEIAESKYKKIKEIKQKIEKANTEGKLISSLEICLKKEIIYCSYEEIVELVLSLNSSGKGLFVYTVDTFCSLIESQRFQDAIVYIGKAVKMFPEDNTGFGYHSQGFCYLKLKDYQSAILNCTKAIDINPHLGLAYFVRGQAYFLPYYDNFNENREKDDSLERINKYGDDAVAIDHYNNAIDDYSNVIEILPDHPESYYWRAICNLFKSIRFRIDSLERLLLLTKLTNDLRKSAEIHFKQSNLTRCKEILIFYSELIEMYKDVLPNCKDEKQLLSQWISEYFVEVESR